MTSEEAALTCRFGKGKDTCRYLVLGADGFECAHGTSLQPIIDARIEEKSMHAVGKPLDSCLSAAIHTMLLSVKEKDA